MNKLKGIVSQIQHSGGITLVDLKATDISLSALIIDNGDRPSWLYIGSEIWAIFKETEVSIAKNFSGEISLRNKIPGNIISIEKGELLSIITITTNHFVLKSAITSRSSDMMNLKEGDHVIALIKANEISLMQM